MKQEETKKGFNLIELIIVVAVIGILAGIIFVAAGPARKKAKDVKIKSGLVQLRNIAENIYLGERNYDRVDTTLSSDILNIQNDITAQGGSLTIRKPTSSPPAYGYCAYSHLISSPNAYFCVDSFGFAGIISFAAICDGLKICLANSCPDFNYNGWVECGFNDPGIREDPIKAQPCPNQLIDPTKYEYSDSYCVYQCIGANFTNPNNPYPTDGAPNCGKLPCFECTDWGCIIYDMNGDNAVGPLDAVYTTSPAVLGKSCIR